MALLEGEIANVAATVPRLELNASACEVKAGADNLDAIVCAFEMMRQEPDHIERLALLDTSALSDIPE